MCHTTFLTGKPFARSSVFPGGVAMDSKAPLVAGQRRQVERARLGISWREPRQKAPGQWCLHPRSHPNEDGSRRIRIDARSETDTFVVDLLAGEAAELMLELGFALEQAARDEKARGLPGPLSASRGRV
jgi:hypothetical protein